MLANEAVARALQSGDPGGARPLHGAGIDGSGEIVAVLDTGLDWDSCFFAEADGSVPPVNTVGPDGRLLWNNVATHRRKVVAYDFLYSCTAFPSAPGCDSAADRGDWDNQGHGTRAAGGIAADGGTPGEFDSGDAIAFGAQLVIQDAGYVGGDHCSQRPGLGCPLRDLREVLEQAYMQGARVHSNSWGDRQGTDAAAVPPTGNYNDSAARIDAFVVDHPDMVVVFNAGNAGQLGSSSISSPGSAKNTIQVGGMSWADDQGVVLWWSGSGPTRDGRIKPELVAPAFVSAPDSDGDVTTGNCNRSFDGGTSWSAPGVAGAAALVRQYFRQFHGLRTPSAALIKATLVAAARPLGIEHPQGGQPRRIPAVPSYDQGFGMPVLDDVLPIPGDPEQLWVRDIDTFKIGDRDTRFDFEVESGGDLVVALSWLDPPGPGSAVSDELPRLINDLDLRVTSPSGTVILGNHAFFDAPDRVNNIELVRIESPEPGRYTVNVTPHAIRSGEEQGAAIVVSGQFASIVEDAGARRRAVRRP